MAYAQYPPGLFEFEYRTPPRNAQTPQPGYYNTHRFSSYNTPSPRGSPNPKAHHTRRASQEYYSSTRPPNYTSHSTPRPFAQSTPLRPEYARRFRNSDGPPRGASGYPQRSDSKHQSSTRYFHNQSPPKRPSTTKPQQPPRHKASEDDARRAGIPAGYSYKNWDPTEEPITLLGSVFDANSLGKWIYDWTVFRYGAATPFSDIAGDLWLLLIQLAGKVKRADHLMPKIRREDNREMVEDFLESGERLWIRFKKLLKICEDYMWKAAKRNSGEKKPMQMGKDSGCEFVDSLFGRDRELDKTEKLMSAVRLWSMRFDANCEEILRNPSA
ncbi:hypothetical protein NA57DRAFT_68646 [Rhizodiscina lignyota]|uniref:Vegetative cell wall protein gp1 n=1 Tax=Rhizodiscina lignyota TaxID=1504668 RepID=A0A9P4M2G7_9PEZI|nr:hypothetical protein NA57DRAFT_68646 [Rhizodiscina lignyota]